MYIINIIGMLFSGKKCFNILSTF